MAFFSSAVETLQTLVVALGAGLAVWGVINLLEGYGSDNRARMGRVDKEAGNMVIKSMFGGQTELHSKNEAPTNNTGLR
jgi:hypothetical protein